MTSAYRNRAALTLVGLSAVLAGVLDGCRSAPVRAPGATAPTPAAVAATPTPAPVAPPPTPAPTPPEAQVPSPPVVPATEIRVLLGEDVRASLPDPGRRYRCVLPGSEVVIRGPIVAVREKGTATLQAGAFGQQGNAEELAGRLARAGVETRVEAGGDSLWRVVAVARADQSEKDLRALLAREGVAKPMGMDASGGEVRVSGEDGQLAAGPTVRLEPLDPEPVAYGRSRYRGAFVLRPGDSGVRVINVLDLESYLRGVVPAEMGPHAFPAIEALKAQAVAARTYAVAHLGEYDTSGYDICATTACQVYGGATVEQPLTDRAVTETEGMIATYQGKPIDAMYHSTCGGHTEDAAALLPERAAPYLVGVPCRAEERVALGSGQVSGPWMDDVGTLATIGTRLAGTVGADPQSARSLARALSGHVPGKGLAGLLRAFDLDHAPELLHGDEGAPLEQRVLRLLATFRLTLPPRGGHAEQRWEMALVVRLAQLAGDVTATDGRVLAGAPGPRFVDESGGKARTVPTGALVIERGSGGARRAPLDVPAGSDATLWCAAGICPVIAVTPRIEADDRSLWGWWVRDVPLAEIARAAGMTSVTDVRVLDRGKSGRALRLELRGLPQAKIVPSFPLRLAIHLPDTLYTVSIRKTVDGPVAHFVGRGWGHGIGMCQNGAYGLAVAGASYEEILRTYYTGIALVRWGEPTGGS